MRRHANFGHWLVRMPMTAEENRALARQYRDGSGVERESARLTMILGNQALVKQGALKFPRSRLDVEDRMQEGNFGLMRAIEEYDPERAMFSTYASKKIYAAIQKADRNRSHIIHVPVWVQEIRREDKPEFLAAGQQAMRVWSLDLPAPEGESQGGGLGDPLRNSVVDSDDGRIDENERDEAVALAVSRLPERQQTVVRMKHGFGCEVATLEEIGRAIGGVTKERARQIRRDAEDALREMPELLELAS